MRTALVLPVLAALLAGCQSTTEWWTPPWAQGQPPVSVPTTAEPATQPAAAPPAPAPAAPDANAPLVARPKAAPAHKPPAAPPPAAQGGPVMAYVNEKPIYMAELTDLLIAGYGMSIAQQLIANELVRQEAARQKVAVTDDDVLAEHERTLEDMFGSVADPNQRQRLLDQLLERNRVSEVQWKLTMRRNALLARLAAKSLVITEDDLKEEFGRQHERKVEVQHIQTATLADAQKVLRELASGAEFTAMVHKYSTGTSAKNGGMLAPFGAKDTGTPPALREAGLAMRKIGEVSSPIQIGTAFHLIKLLRIVEPKDVKFQDVRGALHAAVRKRKIAALQQDILQILIQGARVRYVEPILKAQADKGSGP